MQKGTIEDGDDVTDYYLNWPEFRAALKPRKVKKHDPKWNEFVKQNSDLNPEKNWLSNIRFRKITNVYKWMKPPLE